MNNNAKRSDQDKILCKFFLQGNCKNGSRCAWLHDGDKKKELSNKSGSDRPPNPNPAAEKNPQPCFFFFSGNCIKAENCPYSHELLFDEEETDPDAADNSNRKLEAVTIVMDKTMQQLVNDSKDKECSICFDGVVSQKRLFGLLSSCDHVYCLECIRNWRATDQHDADKAVESVSHTCPLCRQLSLFVVPSPVHASGQIKNKITARYLQRLKQIPCKYFKYGLGYCPFNAACFYAHVNKDGSVATLEQNLRNKPRARRRPGFLIDGQQPLIMSTRLLEMLLPFLSDNVRSQVLAYSIDEEDEELFDYDDEDVMSDDDDDSDGLNMDYTHESDDSDIEDGEDGSGSASDGVATTMSYAVLPRNHNTSYAFYDSDSDAPERQLYDGNNDPDCADEISFDSDSGPVGVKYRDLADDESSDSSDSDSDSEEDSMQERSGAVEHSPIAHIDMSDSSSSAPNLESDSSDDSNSTPREYDIDVSGSDSQGEYSGSSPELPSHSSMSEEDSSSVSIEQYEDGESDYNNCDSDDCVSD
jgi:E3 ubiquitin-protein ligase makorin